MPDVSDERFFLFHPRKALNQDNVTSAPPERARPAQRCIKPENTTSATLVTNNRVFCFLKTLQWTSLELLRTTSLGCSTRYMCDLFPFAFGSIKARNCCTHTHTRTSRRDLQSPKSCTVRSRCLHQFSSLQALGICQMQIHFQTTSEFKAFMSSVSLNLDQRV